MWAALPDLTRIAPRAGFSGHKTTLRKQLDRQGAISRQGVPRRGGTPLEYFVDSLPTSLKASLELKPTSDRFDSYLCASASMKARADERLALMEAFASLAQRTGALQAAAELASRSEHPSVETILGYWRRVRDLPWSEWRAALLSEHKGRAPILIPEPAWRFFRDFYGREEKPTLQYAFEETLKAASHHGWGELPSMKTFSRRWNALPAATRVMWREGRKGAERLIPTGDLDRSASASLDSFAVDGRQWDIFVEGKEGRPYRPWVVAAVDEASSYVLAYVVGEEGEVENGDLYRRLLMAAFEHGLPNVCVRFDNTMAAAGKKISGATDIRFRFTRKTDEVKGILARLNVLAKFTLPSSPQGKIVERMWGDVKERGEKHPLLAGAYTGRSPGHKPSNYGSKAVPRDVFLHVIALAFREYNERTGRRSKAGSCYRTAFEAKLEGVVVRKLTAHQKRWFYADAQTVTPSPDGKVRLGKAPYVNTYWHADLRDHAGRKIVVLVDPSDFTAPLMAMDAETSAVLVPEVPLFEKRGANDAASARELAQAKSDLRKADKARRIAEGRRNAAEIAAAMAPAERPDDTPSAPIVQMVPGTRPNVVAGPRPKAKPRSVAAQQKDDIDWRALTQLAVDEDDRRWGAA